MVNQRQDGSCISMNKEEDYRYPISITFTIPETSTEVIIRNISVDDIDKILQLQEVSFADMAFSRRRITLLSKNIVKCMKSLRLLFSQLLCPTNPKKLWCFACNSMKITCLHDCCPEHCNMCDRIKAIVMRTNGSL